MKKIISVLSVIAILFIAACIPAAAADFIPGDVNGNGTVLADDARLALRASARLQELDVDQRKAADVDGDGQVLAADARQILRYSARLQTKFEPAVPAEPDISSLKIGLICLHDENSTYDKRFIDAMFDAKAQLGLADDQVIIKTNVEESVACYEAAAELVEEGCNLIFADSFGHEDFMIQAALDFPEVQFCHASGTKAHNAHLTNYHNAYAAIHEGWFLTGIAAGMKLNAFIEDGTITAENAQIGYVGAYPYAEVKSAYTSFFLGVRYICPSVTMEVKYTNSWYDEALEKEAAYALIQDGCVLLSQYSDSLGAPTVCEDTGIPNVSYNGSTKSAGPTTYIISSGINWAPYYIYAAKAVAAGAAIDADWTGTLATGSVELYELNAEVAADGTADKIAVVMALIESGSLHVFDTSTFTIDGYALDSYLADVDYDYGYTPDTEVVYDGYFHESEYRSSPYFDLLIDGITEL